jgi:DNA polymerase-3 subunit epsilon
MSKRFAVVDIETTGALVRRDRITEIGIVITDGEKVLDEYGTLVNPGISIPPFITKITGITDEMVADAPKFHEVARKIVEMTEGCIFVAHNVRFDYGFLRSMFEELGYAYNKKRLCTVQLARKVLDLQKYSLGTLIQHFGIEVNDRHRALEDARATTIVLHHLLKSKNGDHQISSQINRGVRESLLPPTITIEDLHALPETPGVYYFLDEYNDVVYVGKSKNIQKRIMQHFTKTTRKAAQLQRRVRSFDYQLTGNDLIAQILEAHEIKTLRPEINRAQRTESFNTYIVTYENSLGYKRFDVTHKVASHHTILDAFARKKNALSLLEYMVNEYALCPLLTNLENGMGPCSLHQYQKCMGACVHEEDPLAYNERALLAHDHMNNRFDRDFVLIDEGRSKTEKSVVLILDGQYHGHAFVEEDVRIESKDDWMDHVRSWSYYPEINSMIRRYIDKGNGEKMLFI